jgi:hypothetical protein
VDKLSEESSTGNDRLLFGEIHKRTQARQTETRNSFIQCSGSGSSGHRPTRRTTRRGVVSVVTAVMMMIVVVITENDSIERNIMFRMSVFLKDRHGYRRRRFLHHLATRQMKNDEQKKKENVVSYRINQNKKRITHPEALSHLIRTALERCNNILTSENGINRKRHCYFKSQKRGCQSRPKISIVTERNIEIISRRKTKLD